MYWGGRFVRWAQTRKMSAPPTLLARFHMIMVELGLTFFTCFLFHANFNDLSFEFVLANQRPSSWLLLVPSCELICCYYGLDFGITSRSPSYSFFPHYSLSLFLSVSVTLIYVPLSLSLSLSLSRIPCNNTYRFNLKNLKVDFVDVETSRHDIFRFDALY